MKKKNINTFFYNTLFILITGLFIKALGLINKVIITRLLGLEGMSLYILSFPTIILFINLASLNLNLSVSKLVSESVKTKKYSPKKILSKSIKLSLIFSIILIALFLIILKPLTTHLLKNEALYYPLLTTVVLIPLVGISDSLKGYFNGLKQMQTSSIASLVEQIARISFSVAFLYLLRSYGVVTSTTFCLLALSIGELVSIMYSLRKIKKSPPLNFDNTNGEQKAILSIAIPTTLSRLVGSFTYFLEPIIYTAVLTYLAYTSPTIQNDYTIINAYTIPLLTIASFATNAISISVVPGISENYSINNTHAVHYYIQKTFIFTLIPAIFTCILLFFYAPEYMKLIYATSEGSNLVTICAFLFIFYYLQGPLVAVLNSLGHAKRVFKLSSIFNILRLVLIGGLAFIPIIGTTSILWGTIIVMIISTIFIIYYVIKETKYRFNKHNCFNVLLIAILTYGLFYLFANLTNINYLIVSIIIGIIYLFLVKHFGLIEIASQKKAEVLLPSPNVI